MRFLRFMKRLQLLLEHSESLEQRHLSGKPLFHYLGFVATNVTEVLPPKYLYLYIPKDTYKKILGTRP